MTHEEAIRDLSRALAVVERDLPLLDKYSPNGMHSRAWRDALKMAVDALREKEAQERGWVDVRERMPDDNSVVLVIEPSGGYEVAWWGGERFGWYNTRDFKPLAYDNFFPSHWRPKPLVPSREVMLEWIAKTPREEAHDE